MRIHLNTDLGSVLGSLMAHIMSHKYWGRLISFIRHKGIFFFKLHIAELNGPRGWGPALGARRLWTLAYLGGTI